MNKIAISAFSNVLNIIIGMVPAFFVIPHIAKSFGNDGIASWNLFLAYVSIFLLIADYGFNDDASKKIKNDSKYLIKIFKAKIYTTLITIFFIISFYILNKARDIHPICIFFTVAAYAFNPIYYYQSKNKVEIPLAINILTVFFYILIIKLVGDFSLEQIMNLFALRVAITSITLWYIVSKELKLNAYANLNIIEASIWIELKNNFQRFFSSLISAFMNSGYIILASMQLEKNIFAQYTMIHKLALIGLMFVISYCQTVMITIKNTKPVICLILVAGIFYMNLSEEILEIFGVKVEEVKTLQMHLFGALFFVTMAVATIYYFKILHIGAERLMKINLFNIIAAVVIFIAFSVCKIPDYWVISTPVLYSVLYLIFIYIEYRKII
jgi:hypothetical protein